MRRAPRSRRVSVSKAAAPELKKFLVCARRLRMCPRNLAQDKKIKLSLNGRRTVTGLLRGFDPFM